MTWNQYSSYEVIPKNKSLLEIKWNVFYTAFVLNIVRLNWAGHSPRQWNIYGRHVLLLDQSSVELKTQWTAVPSTTSGITTKKEFSNKLELWVKNCLWNESFIQHKKCHYFGIQLHQDCVKAPWHWNGKAVILTTWLSLTHWPLGDLDLILKVLSSILLYWLVSSDLLMIMPSVEWHVTYLKISQHWFR